MSHSPAGTHPSSSSAAAGGIPHQIGCRHGVHDRTLFRTDAKGSSWCCWLTVAAANSSKDGIFTKPHAWRHVAQRARGMFAYPLSDHVTEMNALVAYKTARDPMGPRLDTNKWCEKHFINRRAAEEALTVKNLLEQWWRRTLGEGKHIPTTPLDNRLFDSRMRQALAQAFFFNSAVRDRGSTLYYAVRDNKPYTLDPYSVLNGILPDWVVCSRVFSSSRPYLVRCTAINVEHVMVSLAAHLLKKPT